MRDNELFIDAAFYVMALVAVLVLIVPLGGEPAMTTRDQPKIFGRFDMVVDDKGQVKT